MFTYMTVNCKLNGNVLLNNITIDKHLSSLQRNKTIIYLDRISHFHNWFEMWKNELTKLFFGTAFCDQQHIWKNKWNHCRIDKLFHKAWNDSGNKHSKQLLNSKISPLSYLWKVPLINLLSVMSLINRICVF